MIVYGINMVHSMVIVIIIGLTQKARGKRERPTQKFIYGWIFLKNILRLTSGEPN